MHTLTDTKAKILMLLEHLKNRDFKPYTLKSTLTPAQEYSDLFVMRADYARATFLAENIYALLKTSVCSITHEFRFFNPEGLPIGTNSFHTDKYFSCFELDPPRASINPDQPYISFTHSTTLDQEAKDDCYAKGIRPIPLHRGYLRQSKLADHMGSVVHGSFGGISPQSYEDNAAKQRRHGFEYMPNYQFNPDFKYDLVFNNPTDKDLKLTIKSYVKQGSNQLLASLKIASLGTKYLTISNLEGLITIESRMPICRPIIFQNPDLDDSCLNIFHS